MKHVIGIASALVALGPGQLLANDTEGAWSEVFDWPVTAIHMSLLHTGHIILWSVDDQDRVGWGEPFLLDPTGDCFDQADGCFTEKPNPANVFCGGHAQLSDGSLLVNGGHVRNDVGLADTFLFQYDREADDWNWTAQGELPDSHYARWYSTLTTLADGRVLNVSGSEKRCAAASVNADQLCLEHTDCGTEEEQFCEVRLVAPPEVFDPATRDWTLLDNISTPVQYYPFNFVAPNGQIFFSGADAGAETIYIPSDVGLYFDVEGGSLNATGQLSTIDGGSAVMYRPGQVLKCGGTRGSGTTTAAEIVNLNVSEQWNPTGEMNIPRRRHNLTLLPDGTVLVTGGTRVGNREFEFDGTCGTEDGIACNSNNACAEEEICIYNPSGEQHWVAEAEIWNPDTNIWTTMAGAQTPRLYHSSALLLPDGRVISAGGGPRGFDGALNTYTDAEIFSPPYLFRESERPVIDDVPEIIYYGNAFEVISEQAPDVDAVNLIRLGAVTHSFDQNTRFVPLSFSHGIDDTLDVQAPPNGNIAPPGYYMLFLVSSGGVPSVARFVRILPPDPGADMLYEYSAKIVCGRQEEGSGPEQRTAGRYATSVNIHNPFPASVRFFKKLALTAPPGMQQPGEILPIGEDVLNYDKALQTDCRELRKKLISTEDAPVIEGFLVIQSPESLDVTAVYTTAAVDERGNVTSHSSIHVEQVRERDRARVTEAATDLLIRKAASIRAQDTNTIINDGVIRSSGATAIVRYLIDVINQGPAAAHNVVVSDTLQVQPGTLMSVPQGGFNATHGGVWSLGQVTQSSAELEATIPVLPANEHAVLEFVVVVQVDFVVSLQAELRNTASVTSDTTELDPSNNSVVITTTVNP